MSPDQIMEWMDELGDCRCGLRHIVRFAGPGGRAVIEVGHDESHGPSFRLLWSSKDATDWPRDLPE